MSYIANIGSSTTPTIPGSVSADRSTTTSRARASGSTTAAESPSVLPTNSLDEDNVEVVELEDAEAEGTSEEKKISTWDGLREIPLFGAYFNLESAPISKAIFSAPFNLFDQFSAYIQTLPNYLKYPINLTIGLISMPLILAAFLATGGGFFPLPAIAILAGPVLIMNTIAGIESGIRDTLSSVVSLFRPQ